MGLARSPDRDGAHVSAGVFAADAAKRLLAISVKKLDRAAKLRDDADGLVEEAGDLQAAAWSLDPSTDPRPAEDVAFQAAQERVTRFNVRLKELLAQGLERSAAEVQAMIDCP